ncbi:MAG: tyrosine--tRNA ligase [Candidatus Omnitrophica bacterium]|nr:tyrosine--tRNA ligase [Candidatus Omnitrophota bacterium]
MGIPRPRPKRSLKRPRRRSRTKLKSETVSLSKETQDQLQQLTRGVSEVISEDELAQKLEQARKEKRPLRVKAGFDPTAPDLHLGHTVLFRKLRQFQDLGHRVQFLIGDYTSLVGDPSGQNQTRPRLTPEQVEVNAQTYRDQIGMLLQTGGELFETCYNSRWFGEMSFANVIDLSSRYTVARLIERDDFSKRLKEGRPISLLELLYPLMQGYDSVALQADIELGGTDQKFNLLVGRDLQREYGQAPQVVMTLPLLEGLDGVQKMSKSLGNYVGIYEAPGEMFGKLMSIGDELMWKYFELLTQVPVGEIETLRTEVQGGRVHPKAAKVRLAQSIVTDYHGVEAARAAAEEFDRIFSRREDPTDVAEKTVPASELNEGRIWIVRLLELSEMAPSRSEARRLIQGGGVVLDGRRVEGVDDQVELKAGALLKVGKRRFVRLSPGN